MPGWPTPIQASPLESATRVSPGEGLHAGAADLAVVHLGFHVEADFRGVGVAGQLVHVLELGDPVALDDVLVRVAGQLHEAAV
ncbi:hypothetical protein [Pseudarthrobacter sp. IC2-21]|uniref:hypothetical protein n=1 Tax=Pseudarthrobacter sp. IC2-21 TaxID=3092262 RepID=UPI002A6B3E16|nr:hypothetical protein [Pseudarthrobacter sp. IC2-21]